MTNNEDILGSKERYQFIPRVVVFLTRGDEVLLMKRAADREIFPNLYNGLGGHVERGESIREAARREVLEESGLSAKGLWLCAVVAIDILEKIGISMFVFRGEDFSGEMINSPEGELEWVPRGRLDELDMVEDVPTLLPRILEMKKGDEPLWGFYDYDDGGKLRMKFEN